MSLRNVTKSSWDINIYELHAFHVMRNCTIVCLVWCVSVLVKLVLRRF